MTFLLFINYVKCLCSVLVTVMSTFVTHAMLAWVLAMALCLCLSQARVLSKGIND